MLFRSIRERRGFICITGEVGAGKTTLCRALLDEFDEQTRIALILNPMLSDVELLETIDDEFFIQHSGTTKKELLDALNDYLIEQHSAGRNVVLLIDEAQNLSAETLEQIRIISNLETVKDKLIQIVLIGQPELREKHARPELRQLNQRITVRYHLTPMNEEETSAYIQHRLAVAGSAGGIRFTPEAIREIYRFAAGVPRSVNVIADRALLIAYVGESFLITRETVLKARDEVAGIPASETKRTRPGKSVLGKSVESSIAVLAIILVLAAGSYLVISSWRDLSSRPKHNLISRRNQEIESRAGDRRPTPRSQVSAAVNPMEGPSVGREEAVPRIIVNPETGPLSVPLATGPSEIVSAEAPPTVPVDVEEMETASPNVHSSTPVTVVAVDFPEITPAAQPTEPATAPAFEPPPLPPSPKYFSAAMACLAKAWLSEGLQDEDFAGRLEKGDSGLDTVLADLGLHRIEMILDFEALRQLGLPMVLEVESPGSSTPRFVLPERVTEEEIEIRDPLGGNETMSKDAFSRIWFGRVHVCVPAGSVTGRIVGPGSYGGQVHRLETDLHKLGYIASPPDDVWDEETGAALKAFQRDHNLKVDGLARVETQLNLFIVANRDRLPSLHERPGEKKI